MADPVKPKRSYHSPRRVEQAAATRLHILRVAQQRFERDGYMGTSMAAVATEAEVALKTVYLVFTTKGGLLEALWQFVLGGQDDDDPVTAREWYLEMIQEADPEKQLRLNARNSCAVKQRAGRMLGVISDAASGDPHARALWTAIQSDFHQNQASVVEVLADKDALRPRLGVDEATDILWTLNHPDVWRLLVNERGWTAEKYEAWIADAAVNQLLQT